MPILAALLPPLVLSHCGGDSAATGRHLVRIAHITVRPGHLDRYHAFLKEEVTDSLNLEPGVLALFPVSDKKDPARITIVEIYRDEAAYKSHLRSPHFNKYKEGTREMVDDLELIDASPVIPGQTIRTTTNNTTIWKKAP